MFSSLSEKPFDTAVAERRKKPGTMRMTIQMVVVVVLVAAVVAVHFVACGTCFESTARPRW